MELDSKRWTTSIAKHTQSVLSRCFFSMQFPNVNYFRQQCLCPPFSKGEMLKRESASVDRKYLRMPLFRVRVPLFGKDGLGEICGVRSGLQFFSQLPFFKGGFNLAPPWKSMS